MRPLLAVFACILFAAFLGVFSQAPSYQAFPADKALIKLSLSHAGERKEPCRQRSEEELAAQPRHLRKAQDCPRERAPVLLEMEIDGKPAFSRLENPAGLSNDGASTFYATFPVATGKHRLILRLRDNMSGAFTAIWEGEVDLSPRQVLAVGFHGRDEGFFLH